MLGFSTLFPERQKKCHVCFFQIACFLDSGESKMRVDLVTPRFSASRPYIPALIAASPAADKKSTVFWPEISGKIPGIWKFDESPMFEKAWFIGEDEHHSVR